MTATPKSSPIRWISTLALCLLSLQSALAGPEQDKTATEAKPSRFAQYYGFGPMEILKLQWKLGQPIIADVNADGLNDLIFINNRKARIDLLLQKKDFDPSEYVPIDILDEDVNDILGREKAWRFKRFSYDLNVEATSLVLADLNADNRLDLAFYAKDALRVVLQEQPKPPPAEEAEGAEPEDKRPSGPAEPLWMPAKKIDIREGLSTSRALAAGDLNSDGRADLALLAGEGTFVLIQKPDGTLAQPEKFYSAGQKPKQLHIADVNGDKRLDLVVITAEEEFPVRLRYQSNSGKLGPEVRYDLPISRVLEMAELGQTPRSYFLCVNRLSGRIQISTLAPNTRREEFPVFTYPLPATESPENRDIVAADVDGDGLWDVVVSDPSRAEFLLFRGAAVAGLTGPGRFPGLTDMRKLVGGDLDGSGKQAIIALSIEEKIIAISRMTDGRLSFPESVTISDEPLAMDLADINADGQLDLLYVARQKKEKKYFLRTVLSVGRDNAQPGPELELTELKDKPQDLRAGDIDHDSRPDVMVLRPYGPLLLLRQSQAGEFTQVTKPDIYSGLVADIQPSSLSLGPLGPEGGTAVLLAKKNFARAVVFDPAKGWQVVDQYQASDRQSNLTAAVAALLPGDEALAVVVYDAARAKLEILTQQPDGTYRTERDIKIGSVSVKKMLTGNFGGPSPLSILLAGTHKMILLPVAGQTHLLQKLASFESDIKNVRYGAMAVGDVNDDDLPEIVVIDQAHNRLEILAFDAEGQLTSASKFKAFEEPRAGQRRSESREPRIVCLGDVTADGKNDIILVVHDRIIIYPQD